MERTLAIIKPDAFKYSMEIQKIIRKNGFKIAEKKCLVLKPEKVADFYIELREKRIYNDIIAYMSSGPVVVMVLEKAKAISEWLKLCGPKEVILAIRENPDCLRAKFGTAQYRNGLHGSESFAAAEREIYSFFPKIIFEEKPLSERIRLYLNQEVTPVLSMGLTELCHARPADPTISEMGNEISWQTFLYDNHQNQINNIRNRLRSIKSNPYDSGSYNELRASITGLNKLLLKARNRSSNTRRDNNLLDEMISVGETFLQSQSYQANSVQVENLEEVVKQLLRLIEPSAGFFESIWHAVKTVFNKIIRPVYRFIRPAVATLAIGYPAVRAASIAMEAACSVISSDSSDSSDSD